MAKNNRSFLRHAFTYGGGTLLLQAASVVLLPLYTRYLSPAEFGVLEVLSRLGEILNICLMVNGMSKAAIASYRQARDEHERQTTAATLTCLLAAILVVLGFLALSFAGRAGTWLGIADPALVTFGVLTALLQATTAIPLALMQARLESGRFTGANVGMFAMRVSLTILAVVGLGWGVWGVLGANAATSAVAGGLLTLRELHRGSWRPNLQRMPEVARYALPFVPAGLCWFLIYYTDRFLLLRWAGPEELGLYALGSRLAETVAAFSVVPLQRVWSAEMFDAFERPDAAVAVGRTVTRLLGAYVFVGLGLCLLKNEAIQILGSAKYAGAGTAVDVLVLAFFFSNAAVLFDSALYVRRRTRLKPWLNLASALVTIPLFLWLIPKYGAMGAAVALLVGSISWATLTVVVAQRVFRVRYEPRRLAAMLLLAVSLVLASRTLGTGLTAVPGKLLLWAAWPGILLACRLVSDEEKQHAIGAWRAGWAWLRTPAAGTCGDSQP